MKIETSYRKIWDEYQSGRTFNDAIGLYDDVEVNENMYIGKQWEGINAPDLPKPVINVTHLVVSWAIANVVSDDVAVSITALKKNDEIAVMGDALQEEVDRVFEITNAKQKNRMVARNGAVHGDCAKYYWFDPDQENGQAVKGEIKSEIIEGRNVIFGNPYNRNIQDQPYNIIVQRVLVEEARDQARANGIPEDEVMQITADENENFQEESNEYGLCTILIKQWKQNRTIWAHKVTQTARITKKPFDTGMKLYPIAWFVWEDISEQYHGRSIVSGLIQNQISINRILAMYIRSIEMNAWPKVIYDKDKLPNGYSNAVGKAIGVSGGANGVRVSELVYAVRGGDVSSQVMESIQTIISMMKEQIGASDAALGNVRPDNAKAIMAAARQAKVPMELPKLNHNDYVEQEVRIIVDMMRNYYGKREVAADSFKTEDGTMLTDQNGDVVKTISYDFSKLDSPNMRLNVDIGEASYWSEIRQSQTLDNLFSAGIIDALTYVESAPQSEIKNKQKIIEYLKRMKAQAEAQMQTQMPAQMPTQAQGITQQTPSGVIQ